MTALFATIAAGWFPRSELAMLLAHAEELTALANRPKRAQNSPKSREPQLQAARLIRRLVRRAVERFGQPSPEVAIELAGVVDPQLAERLLSLLPTAQSWGQLLTNWHSERS